MRDDSSRGGLRKVRPRTVLMNRSLCSLVTSGLPQRLTDEGIYGKVAANLVEAPKVDDAEVIPGAAAPWSLGYRIQARAQVRDQDPSQQVAPGVDFPGATQNSRPQHRMRPRVIVNQSLAGVSRSSCATSVTKNWNHSVRFGVRPLDFRGHIAVRRSAIGQIFYCSVDGGFGLIPLRFGRTFDGPPPSGRLLRPPLVCTRT